MNSKLSNYFFISIPNCIWSQFCIDHGCLRVAVPQKMLDHREIHSRMESIGGKGMA